MSFGDYLNGVVAWFSWQGALWFGSLALGLAAILGCFLALLVGTETIAYRWHWGWNFLYVPLLIAATVFVLIFASWLGTEVAS